MVADEELGAISSGPRKNRATRPLFSPYFEPEADTSILRVHEGHQTGFLPHWNGQRGAASGGSAHDAADSGAGGHIACPVGIVPDVGKTHEGRGGLADDPRDPAVVMIDHGRDHENRGFSLTSASKRILAGS